MTANEYKNKIKDYTLNMLTYEKTEVDDNIKYLKDDLAFEDDKYCINNINTSLKAMYKKQEIINAKIKARS
jgi:hypothetical protein